MGVEHDFHPDLVRPPGDLYPFVEFGDLNPFQKVTLMKEHYPESRSMLGWATWEDIQRRLEYIDALPEAEEFFAVIRSETQARITEMSEKAKKSATERVVAEGMERYLKADPVEIKAILEALEGGATGKAVKCDEPIPAFTCVWIDGSRIRGVRPGSMSNAVTFDQPVEETVRDINGYLRREYRQRVFLK